jgi:ATP phosphoribosyltransferase regulatory subunit HisZ
MQMSVTTTEAKGPGTRAEALVASYERAGYARIAPAILQPAEPFLDLSGEDIRKRMYLTTAPGGGEFCLRPDLTIPVSRDYLASPLAGQPAGYCYLGPVFRHRSDASAEFLQAGIESRDAGARARSHRALRSRRAGHPDRRRRAVCGSCRRARSAASVEAAADQGFQP